MLVVGGLNVDEVASVKADFVDRASNPVSWRHYVGGVASNAARAANTHYIRQHGGSVVMHTALGGDATGKDLLSAMHSQGIRVASQIFKDQPSDRYSAIMANSGELLMGLADVQLAEMLDPAPAVTAMKTGDTTHLLLDANLSSHCIESVIEAASDSSVAVAALTVSPSKAIRMLSVATKINWLFCNRREAVALGNAARLINDHTAAEQTELSTLAHILSDIGFNAFVLTDGDAGLITGCNGRYVRHAAIQTPIVHNVNGAGDTLAGATLAAVSLGASLDEAVANHGIPMATELITGKRMPLSL